MFTIYHSYGEKAEFATIEEADKFADEHYAPKPPRPMPEYEPLIVTPVASNRKRGQVVAFIGKQMCFFVDRMQNPLTKEYFNIPMPDIGKPIEVMITRPIYKKNEFGHPIFDSIVALLLCPVDEYMLVWHDGFECAGSMCKTTARMTYPKDSWMTPGLCQIFEASNVNSGSTWKVHYTAKRPGKVWIHKPTFEAGHFPSRADGLARVEDAMYARHVRK